MYLTTTLKIILYSIGVKTVYVNNRVWIFGGQDGGSSYWNYMWYSSLLPDETLSFDVNVSKYDFIAAQESDKWTFAAHDSATGYFETWTVDTAVLPVANYYQYVVHDPNSRFPECIWVLGGQL